ncbi:hypothetical protein COPEUT_01878 [Coprococcus eutactus ATCC 27759]|nr:hypothetical protein COPEUT_01878 [Coprococcus eutactus ATCC 27759]
MPEQHISCVNMFKWLDYISERYCAGLKTKSIKIQT